MAIELKSKHIGGIKYEDVRTTARPVDGGSKDPAYATAPDRFTPMKTVTGIGRPAVRPAVMLPPGVRAHLVPNVTNGPLVVTFPAGSKVSFPVGTAVHFGTRGPVQLDLGDGLVVSLPPTGGNPPVQLDLDPGTTVSFPGSFSGGPTVSIPTPSQGPTVTFPQETTVTIPTGKITVNPAAKRPVAPNSR